MRQDTSTKRENHVPKGLVLTMRNQLPGKSLKSTGTSVSQGYLNFHEQIDDNDEQIKYKELRQEGAKNLHNYKGCDVLKADCHRLQLKLTTLKKKQNKADWYLSRRQKGASSCHKSPPCQGLSSSPEPRSPSSGFSAPQTPTSHHTSVASSPSPTDFSGPNTELKSVVETAPSQCESDDTIMVSSSDESKSESTLSSTCFPRLKSQMAVFPTTTCFRLTVTPPRCSVTTQTHRVNIFNRVSPEQ